MLVFMPALTLAGKDGRSLSPDEFLRQIDQNYPKLRGARLEIEVARAKLQEKRGAFDPVLSLDTYGQRYNSSSAPGKAYTSQTTGGTVSVTTRSGVSYFVGSQVNVGQIKSPLSSTGELGEYFVGIKMPLLRNRGLNEKSVAEREAMMLIDVAQQGVALTRLDTLLGGAQAYWDWGAASRKLQIARDLLRVAQVRASQIRERVAAKDLPEIDAVEADTEVKRREGAVAKAERDLQKSELKVALFRWDESGDPDQTAGLAPVDLGTPEALGQDEIALATERAIAQRPELRAIEANRQIVQLALDLAKNDRLPNLDFVLTPGVDAGAGGIGPTVRAGVFYSIPLRQNAVDGRIDEARQKLRKIEIDREFVTQEIRIQILDAASAVEQAFQRYLAARDEVRLAERLESMERERFDLGDGTLFLLNQRERATAEAASRLVDVTAEYRQALAVFEAAAADL